ncbi:MAG: hypothetical protein JRH11_08905 [Deltaproteobacteria bacterium]|nr:hypothetical protein [Deltaproteobacteria bacterium]
MTDSAPSTSPIEHIAFRLGFKPALRLRPGPDLERERARAEARGLATRVRVGGSGQELLYIARDEERAAALAEAEALSLCGTDESIEGHRELGRLLGYPRCCVQAFVTRITEFESADRGQREDHLAVRDALGRTKIAHGRLNPTPQEGGSTLISYYPCRFDCTLSLRYGEAVFGKIAQRWPRHSDEIRRRLMAPVTITTRGTRLPGGASSEGGVTLRFAAW